LPDTFVIVDDHGRMLTKGDAVIHMLERLGGLWRGLGVAFRLLPRRLRDRGYDRVGRIRHRLFPKPGGMCPLVPEALRTRFAA
jgi:predicted DCC family thiol-disulfide oxidoreductase YuxK